MLKSPSTPVFFPLQSLIQFPPLWDEERVTEAQGGFGVQTDLWESLPAVAGQRDCHRVYQPNHLPTTSGGGP